MVLGLFEILLITTTVLEVNPLFQAIKIFKTKKVKNISVLTYFAIFVIGILWLIYGFQIDSIPLIIGNVLKIITSLSVIAIYFIYRS